MEKQIRIFQTFFPEMLEAREKVHVCVSEPEGLIKDNDSRIMSSWELRGGGKVFQRTSYIANLSALFSVPLSI